MGWDWRWWMLEEEKMSREKNKLWERKQIAFTKGIWQDQITALKGDCEENDL